MPWISALKKEILESNLGVVCLPPKASRKDHLLLLFSGSHSFSLLNSCSFATKWTPSNMVSMSPKWSVSFLHLMWRGARNGWRQLDLVRAPKNPEEPQVGSYSNPWASNSNPQAKKTTWIHKQYEGKLNIYWLKNNTKYKNTRAYL